VTAQPRTAAIRCSRACRGGGRCFGTDRIESRATGYLLHAGRDEVDVCRFEQLVADRLLGEQLDDGG
jgi:hypothetical protein